MDTTTESPGAPRTHLASVQDLLTELDRMKTTGIGARERLDFMLARGSELVEENAFDLEDAFDLEARVRVKRLDQLEHLAKAMTTAKGLWADAPIKDDVTKAAMGLFRHLDRFIIDAKNVEHRSHTETLSQIWVSDPDIRWLYPWLTAWTGPIYRPSWADNNGYPVAPAAEEPSEEVKEFAEAKQKLYDETAADQTPVELPEPETKEMAKLFDLSPEEAKKVEERIAEKMAEVKVDPNDIPAPKQIPDEVVVGKVKKEAEPEVDHIRRDAWTQALREMTLLNWNFDAEREWLAEGSEVIIWKTEDHEEARLELVQMSDSTIVTLRILTKDGLRKHEEKRHSVKELHLDPLPFVKKAIDG